MAFASQYETTLALLPEKSRNLFRDSLVGLLAQCVGSYRLEQCLEAAMFMAQDYRPKAPFLVVKGGKRAAL